MKIIITESQLKKILTENNSNEIESKFEKLKNFFNEVNKDVHEILGLDLQFSASWGLGIAGFIEPIARFIKGEFKGLTPTEISLISAGVFFTVFYHNKPKLVKVLAEIKEHGLASAYERGVNKAKELRDVFRSFIGSFGIPLVDTLNILAFAFLIPILPSILLFASGNPTMGLKEFIIRLSAFFPLKYAASVFKKLIVKIIDRFKNG